MNHYKNFLELAAGRYSVRKFADRPIEQEVLDQILKAGHLAPTACNFQPQKILVINSREALEKLSRCTRSFFNAPAAMLICYDKNLCWKRGADEKPSGEVDASIVATHLMLQAAALGVGSTWVMSFDPKAMRSEFNIPENIVEVALLVMGYPAPDAEPSPRHTQYRPSEEIVSYNRF